MMANSMKMIENASSPEEIAAVVYEAATDGKDQLRYVAGVDARELYKQRQAVGDAAFMQYMKEMIL